MKTQYRRAARMLAAVAFAALAIWGTDATGGGFVVAGSNDEVTLADSGWGK